MVQFASYLRRVLYVRRVLYIFPRINGPNVAHVHTSGGYLSTQELQRIARSVKQKYNTVSIKVYVFMGLVLNTQFQAIDLLVTFKRRFI